MFPECIPCVIQERYNSEQDTLSRSLYIFIWRMLTKKKRKFQCLVTIISIEMSTGSPKSILEAPENLSKECDLLAVM